MAGVAPQQRGLNSTLIGMVVAIILAVLLLVALIWLFTQQEQLRRTAEQAQTSKERLASSTDENAARQMFPDAAGPGKSLLGEVNKGVQMLCARLGGNQTDPPKVAVEKLDSTLKAIVEEGKIPDPDQVSSAYGAAAIIENLHQLYRREREANEKTEEELTGTIMKLEAASKANADLQKTFQTELARLSSQVDGLQNAKSEFEKARGGEVEALKQQVNAKQDQLDAMRQDQSKLMGKIREEIGDRDKLLDEQRNALKDLRGPGAHGAQELAMARKPVGTVLRALPGDSLVHIDLGRSDNVTLGMTFSVYSANERIPADGRGKATIEVVSLGDRTAECKVITPPSPDDPILEGDSVGNIILSRNKAKKPQFCIVGNFDVDYDGQPDPRGRDAIEALVRRYGGEVVDTVTATTDYVVVGVEPQGPAERASAETGAGAEKAAKPAKPEAEKAPEAPKVSEEKPGQATEEPTAEEANEEEEEEAEAEEPEAEGPTVKGKAAETAEGEQEVEAATEEEEEEATDEQEEEPTGNKEAAAPAKAGEEKAAEKQPSPEKAAMKSRELPLQIQRPREVDLTAEPRGRVARSERERYREAIRRAEMFSIPRLPQDRFLNFVGIEPGPGAVRRLQQ
jgi:hypothetical protein